MYRYPTVIGILAKLHGKVAPTPPELDELDDELDDELEELDVELDEVELLLVLLDDELDELESPAAMATSSDVVRQRMIS